MRSLCRKRRYLIMRTSPLGIPTATQREFLLSITARFRVRRRSGMSVRSLNSSVLRWPNAEEVDLAVRRWVEEVARKRPEVVRIGYFGSYARGDWGVGSDFDLVVIVKGSRLPFVERAREWDATELPVPVDLFAYTEEEWDSIIDKGRFEKMLKTRDHMSIRTSIPLNQFLATEAWIIFPRTGPKLSGAVRRP